MRRFLTVTLGVALLIGSAAAAEVETSAGSRAVLFSFQGLDDLGVGKVDGGVGLRWYVTDGLALRPVIGYGWTESERAPTEHGDVQYSGSKQSSDLWDVSLVAEKRLAPHGAVSPYLGIGVVMQRQTQSSRAAVPAEPVDGTALKQVMTRQAWGGLAVLGFEYGVLPWITLGGEYRLEYLRSTGETTTYRQSLPDEVREDDTRRSLRTGTAALFLAIAL